MKMGKLTRLKFHKILKNRPSRFNIAETGFDLFFFNVTRIFHNINIQFIFIIIKTIFVMQMRIFLH